MCGDKGKLVPGSIVDHINPHRGNELLFFDFDNTQTLCNHHHASIKQSHELSRFVEVAEDGWPTHTP